MESCISKKNTLRMVCGTPMNTNVIGRQHSPHFTDRETDTERVCNLSESLNPQVTEPALKPGSFRQQSSFHSFPQPLTSQLSG